MVVHMKRMRGRWQEGRKQMYGVRFFGPRNNGGVSPNVLYV